MLVVVVVVVVVIVASVEHLFVPIVGKRLALETDGNDDHAVDNDDILLTL